MFLSYDTIGYLKGPDIALVKEWKRERSPCGKSCAQSCWGYMSG